MLEIGARTRMLMEMENRPDVVEGGFSAVNIESGALCNLQCPFCSTGNGGFQLSREFLTPERLKDILDRLGPDLKSVGLFRLGEPLLNPEIHTLISMVSARGCDTMIHTNLAVPSFDSAAADRLVASGLTTIVISCDGASQETYQQYRAGGRFDVVMRNIALLLEARRRGSSAHPKAVWKFLLHPGNEHERGRAERMAAELGISIHFSALDIPQGLRGSWPDGAHPAPGTAARAANDDTDVRSYPGCLEAWDRPFIHTDGSVLPCCVVEEPEFVIGNIFKDPMSVIWNSPIAVGMRRYLSTGIAPATRIPCVDCHLDPHRRPR
jgi:radical SAM protein with 4Fe4S-binding SPASM domain